MSSKRMKVKFDEDGFTKIYATNNILLRGFSNLCGSIVHPIIVKFVYATEDNKKFRASMYLLISRIFLPLTKWQTSYAMKMDGMPDNVVFSIDKEDYEAHKKKPDPNIFLEEIDKEEYL